MRLEEIDNADCKTRYDNEYMIGVNLFLYIWVGGSLNKEYLLIYKS